MKKTNDYIERDAAIKTINKYRIGLRKQGLVILDGAVAETKKRIDNLPAADVRPVVRALWLAEKDGVGICSNCNRLDHIDPLAAHCRYCGADMRGDKNE